MRWIARGQRAASQRDRLATRSQGVVLVALAPLGHREVATTTRAIRGPADVKGLRLRTSPSPMLPDVLLALGAFPQAMPFAEAQAAFAKGALDGQEGSPTALAAARAVASGQRHLTQWGAIGDAMVFAVRKSYGTAGASGARSSRLRRARRLPDRALVARNRCATARWNGMAVGDHRRRSRGVSHRRQDIIARGGEPLAPTSSRSRKRAGGNAARLRGVRRGECNAVSAPGVARAAGEGPRALCARGSQRRESTRAGDTRVILANVVKETSRPKGLAPPWGDSAKAKGGSPRAAGGAGRSSGSDARGQHASALRLRPSCGVGDDLDARAGDAVPRRGLAPDQPT